MNEPDHRIRSSAAHGHAVRDRHVAEVEDTVRDIDRLAVLRRDLGEVGVEHDLAGVRLVVEVGPAAFEVEVRADDARRDLGESLSPCSTG